MHKFSNKKNKKAMSKTKSPLRKTMIASLFAVISFTALSLQSNAQCQAGFTFTVNTNTVTFTNTSTGASMPTYYWSFGDGSTGWQTNETHAYLSSGVYTVCLTLFDSLNLGGCQSTYCDTLTITNAPNPPCSAYFSYYNDSNNTNGTQFYDLSSNNPTSWYWTFGDGSTSTAQNPSHQYAQTGNYLVCLTIVDAFKDTCTYCDSVAFYVCTIVAGYTANTSGDPTISFTNTSTGGYAPFYFWDFGDGTYASTTNATHTYQLNGTYWVCMTAYDSLSNCSDTYCDTITISNGIVPPCNAQFYAYDSLQNTLPGPIYFYDYSTGGPISWSWNFGDGSTSTLQHPTHQYAQPGMYWVCLTITTASSTCSTCDSVQYKIFGAGVGENANLVTGVQNYPNPFFKSTSISYTLEKNSAVQISVYNYLGSKIAELENSEKSYGRHELEWNAENLPAGIYHLEINAGSNSISRKLVLIK